MATQNYPPLPKPTMPKQLREPVEDWLKDAREIMLDAYKRDLENLPSSRIVMPLSFLEKWSREPIIKLIFNK